MKKALSLLLACLLLLSNTPQMAAAESQASFKEIMVSIYSMLTGSKENETLLLHNNDVYMKLDRILEYTGYTCDYEHEDTVIRLERSGKRVSIDRVKRQLQCGRYTVRLPELPDYQGSIWIPLHPVLLYLNARCEVSDGHLVILAAETTTHEYIKKFYDMVESQLCTIHWAENESNIFYGLAVAWASIMDVIINGRIGEVVWRQYETERCKSILINIMDEIDEESFGEYAMQHYPDIVENTVWFQELDEYSRLDADEVLAAIKIADYAGDVLEVAEYVTKAYNMQEFHIEVVDNVLLKGNRYFGKSFRNSEMYKAANEIISMYYSKRAPASIAVLFVLEHGIDLLYKKLTDRLLTSSGTLIIVGAKLFAAYMGYNTAYDDFLTLKSMYQLQKNLEIAFDAAVEEVQKRSAFSTDNIDFLYNDALLYIQTRIAADRILGINADRVMETYRSFLSVDKGTLYFDDPGYMSENRATADVVSSLPQAAGNAGWVGKYSEIYNQGYGSYFAEYPEEENIPSVELYADGTYQFIFNELEGMLPVNGKWQVDPDNENIVRLFKPDTELFYKGRILEDILLYRITDSEIIILGPEYLPGVTNAGDIYRKKGAIPDPSAKKHWYQVYLDLLYSSADADGYVQLFDINGLGSVRLVDINNDQVPELIIGDQYEYLHLYTVSDNEAVCLTNFDGDSAEISIRQDVNTGRRYLFSTNYFMTVRIDWDGKNPASNHKLLLKTHDALDEFTSIITYYVNGEVTDQESYEKAKSDLENTYELVSVIQPHAIASTNRGSAIYGLSRCMLKYIAENP